MNLSRDADTVGTVAGGLAGAKYGLENIPERWRRALSRHEWAEGLINGFVDSLLADEYGS